MSAELTFPQFLAGWLPAFAITTAVPEVAPEAVRQLRWIVEIGGFPIPLGACLWGALGIALSRPLARKGEAQLGWPLFLVVSLIMLILVELWIIETWPSWLYSFVVSIGLGFAGYSVIELIGEQAKEFIRSIGARAKEMIGKGSSS